MPHSKRCRGLFKEMPLDALARAWGSAGLAAWNALDISFEIWQPLEAGQQPMSPTAQAVILTRRAIAQQQGQQMAQVRMAACQINTHCRSPGLRRGLAETSS